MFLAESAKTSHGRGGSSHAFAHSSGNAALLDGRMIDRPVLVKAQAILAQSDAEASRLTGCNSGPTVRERRHAGRQTAIVAM